MIGQNKPLEIDYNDYSSEESFHFIARILTSLTTLMLMWGITVFVFLVWATVYSRFRK